MKNKRLYKYLLEPVFDMAISVILALVSIGLLKLIVEYLYKYTTLEIINQIYRFWNVLTYIQYKELVQFGIIVVVIIAFYVLITYRKTKSLVAILNETEIMANGDLDRIIEVTSKGDIGKLASNINNISKQLKDITVDERNAQKTKTDLITNVSHDLRTPLTSIIGYLELIENDKYKDEVELRYYTSIAYEKSKGLNILINDLFELTKMQNNTINIQKVELNLVELLGQVVAYFEYQFKNANMKSRVNFSDDKLIVVADAGKLVRAIENLLSNAIKYGQNGYYVDVVTKLEDNNAIIQVINYGETIPAIDLPHIFDRFYRVEKSRNRDVAGSGLGLAITKNIIELHNGTIDVYSSNERTIFEVRLPVK